MIDNRQFLDEKKTYEHKFLCVGDEDPEIDRDHFRNEKIVNLTLLGYSMSRVASEMSISRSTVRMVLKSKPAQEKLYEAFQSIDHAMIGLPEVTGMALAKLKVLIEEGGCRNLEQKKFELECVKVALGLATKIREIQGNVIQESVATLN